MRHVLVGVVLLRPRRLGVAQRSLTLARDPLGIKPLYFARNPDPRGSWSLAFASEIRAIMAQKGLRIGQSLEQGQQYEFRYRPQPNLTPEEQAVLNKPVTDLNLSVRARKCMNRLGINSLGDLTRVTESQLLTSKNFGITSLNEVKEKLGQYGLKLRGD